MEWKISLEECAEKFGNSGSDKDPTKYQNSILDGLALQTLMDRVDDAAYDPQRKYTDSTLLLGTKPSAGPMGTTWSSEACKAQAVFCPPPGFAEAEELFNIHVGRHVMASSASPVTWCGTKTESKFRTPSSELLFLGKSSTSVHAQKMHEYAASHPVNKRNHLFGMSTQGIIDDKRPW